MDVGLVAGLVPAQAAIPARAAGAQPAAVAAAGFGTALARALGASAEATPVSATGDAPPATTAPGIDLRQLLAGFAWTAEPGPGLEVETAAEGERKPRAQATETQVTETQAQEAQTSGHGDVRHRHAMPAPVPMPADPIAAPVVTATDGDAPQPTAADAVPVDDAVPVTSTATHVPVPPARSDVPVTRAERSLERLAPEFRSRLERVVTRMRDELGLDVRVVETFRTQERQDALYAQGRSTRGPTVTWTRSSNHTLGLAADVRVDGAEAPKAYAQLARVAAEEGLRTLGPKDPGHIELADGRPAARAAERSAELPLPANGIARVARVATVAQPAAVAQVARVAQVAVPGSRGPQPAPSPVPDRAAPIVARRVDGDDAQDAHVPTARPEPVVARTESQTSTEPLAAAASAERSSAGDAKPAGGAAPVQGNDIASRVARLMALQDASAEAPTTGMTLLLDGENGAEARIRLGVRGTSVGATIDVADPAEALRLGNRIGELRRALERHGLEPATVAVRDVPGLKEIGERMHTVALAPAAVGVSESSAGSRPGDTGGDRPSGQQRRDPGTAEDRPRRNPKEERK